MRRKTVGILALIVLSSVAPIPATGAQSFVSVTDVSVAPKHPMPGEVITVRATIKNTQKSNPIRVTDVAIRKRGTADELVRSENTHRISPGSSTTVQLTFTLEKKGTQFLDLNVYTHGNGTSKYPLSITVGGQNPGIDIQTDDPVTGAKNTGTLTVSNGLDTSVRSVKTNVQGEDGFTVTNGRQNIAKLESGASASTNFTYRASKPGKNTLNTTMTYVTAAGTKRTVSQNSTVVVEKLRDDVVLDTSTVGSASSRAIKVDILNRGNADIEDISLTGSSSNATVQQALVGTVPAGESRPVRLNVSLDASEPRVNLEATYNIGSRQKSVSTVTTVRSVPGSIDLAGVRLTHEDGSIHISGSASNVGLTDVDSVKVSVLAKDGVTPAYPNKEYFVGTVPASDFVSFDVYATTSANTSSIPVEVSYLVDGKRRSPVFQYETSDTGGQNDLSGNGNSGENGGSSPLIPAVVGVLALGGVAGLVYQYTRGDSDDEQ